MGGAAEFAKVYENVHKHKLAHCALCFRSEEEVALVEPSMFRKAMRALKYKWYKHQQSLAVDKVCYMCEARAGAVVRFLDNVQLAIQLSVVLHKASCEEQQKRFKQSLCQDNFMRMRKRTQLTLTDVLYVNVGDKHEPSSANDKTPEVEKNLNRSNTVKRTAPLAVKKLVTRPAKVHPRETPNALKKKEDKHPQTRIPSSMLSSKNKKVRVTVGRDGFLHVISSNSKLTEAPERKRFIQNTNGVTTKKLKVNDKNLNIIIRNPPSRLPQVKNVLAVDAVKTGQVVEKVVKLPVRNDSGVDWEDKIPMEVILFGESKEPAAAPAPANGQPRLVLSAPYEYRTPSDAPT